MSAEVECPVLTTTEIGNPEITTTKPVEMDYLTKRPRERNIPYTDLTDEQIRNIKQDASSFFMISGGGDGSQESVHGPGREGGRFYKDRYTYPGKPSGLVGEKYDRNSQGPRTTSEIHAHFKWGPNRAGDRTLSHYTGEKVNDYMTIDCYRRPPTNLPGQIVFKYGRPAGGYYEQRDPRGKLEPSPQVTTGILKTQSQYDLDRTDRQAPLVARTGQWPEWSEYTDKYLLNNATEK